jgi:hypothetical protein
VSSRRRDKSPSDLPRAGSPRAVWAGRLALAAAAAFVIALAVRPINSNDLGYHLAYGDTFLDTGRLVDGNDFVYAPIDPASLDAPGNLPPGAWYDRKNKRYHFPNANYLSQIVMSLAYRAGGFWLLSLLQVALVAQVVVCLMTAMRRMGVPSGWAAMGLLLFGMAAYERFDLRPEMFGYACLAGLLLLLSSRKLSWGVVAGMIALQWLFVQMHSYWMLGLALAGAFWADAAARAMWARFVRRAGVDADLRFRLIRLSIVVGGMALVALVNPWTWRLVAQPAQTLWFLRANGIPAAADARKVHPWATIGEFLRPFGGAVFDTRPTVAFVVVLALATLGAITAAIRRRWAWLLATLALVAVSLSMRRNIAAGAMVLVPMALASLTDALGAMRPKVALLTPKRRRSLALAGCLALILASGYWTVRVVTSGFYYDERRTWRFGWGAARRDIPVELARLLPALSDEGRTFATYNVSSTVAYFGAGGGDVREVPILTNTWAYPASIMSENLLLAQGKRNFAAFAKAHGIRSVVIDCRAPLAGKLLLDPQWEWVRFDGVSALFVREDVEVPEEIRDRRSLDQILREVESHEPLPAFALQRYGTSLFAMGLEGESERFFRAVVRLDDTYYEAWNQLGVLLARRGPAHTAEARKCFQRALQEASDYAPAAENLRRLEDNAKPGTG